jgi:hypothetical protein
MRSATLLAILLGACGSDEPGHDYYVETGECDPPDGATDLGATATSIESYEASGCFNDFVPELDVVESQADWEALMQPTCNREIPSGVDFATERAAVIQVQCSPTGFRFAADDVDEVVVGVKSGISGACLGNVLVVPLPRSTKPVRLARCQDSCVGECPPVP